MRPVQTKSMPVHTVTSHSTPQDYFQPGITGQEVLHPGSAGQTLPSTSLFDDSSLAGACNVPPEPDSLVIDTHLSDASYSDDQVSSDEGEISSDTLDKPEQTEDMNYRETVRSIRSFMGWNHIPTFESDLSEPDKSNNPWKGKLPKRPTRISVAMPPDDWLCQKLEKLNTVVAEGYPSRAQDSAGLKKDKPEQTEDMNYRETVRSIRSFMGHSWAEISKSLVPNAYDQTGWTASSASFSWHDSEAKVNSQFPRIIKASAYPSTGPPSHPISEEYLHRWEKCARENSYIVNHAAAFNCCTSELQERMTAHINLLSTRINKGKAPKEVSAAMSSLLPFIKMFQWQWELPCNTWRIASLST